MNAKEFAVCAGVSYSTARTWFRLPGFPVFHGVIFWQDFARWRKSQNGFKDSPLPPGNGNPVEGGANLPPRAVEILHQA